MTQAPSIGRIVHYKLNEQDATAINKRRSDWRNAHPTEPGITRLGTGEQAHIGNEATAGDVLPAMIVRTWGSTPQSSVQLQVFLDGNDTFWATSVSAADVHPERTYIWPPRV